MALSELRKLAVIGDVHAHWEHLDRVLEQLSSERLEGLLLVGDLGSHDLSFTRRRTHERDARYLAAVEEVLRRCSALGVPVRYVPGNHDLPDLPFPGNLDGRVECLAGLRIAGIGGAGPGRYGFAYEWDEEQIDARVLPACDLLLCHAPPRDTSLDLLYDGLRHVGSAAIRRRALAHQGVMVCGHIHESPGAEQLGRCLCLNAGGLGEPFGQAQVGYVEWSGAVPSTFAVSLRDLEKGTVLRWEREG